MSWYSKVFWSEGLFLRPHHLQQNDRYHEQLLERRVGHVTPYPWGFSALERHRELAQQSKLRPRPRRATGPRGGQGGAPPQPRGGRAATPGGGGAATSGRRKPSSTRARRCA